MPGSRPAGLNTCRRRCEEALTFPLPPPVIPGAQSGVAPSEDGSLSNGPPAASTPLPWPNPGNCSRGVAEIAESRRGRQTRNVHKKVPKGRTTIAQGNALWTPPPLIPSPEWATHHIPRQFPSASTPLPWLNPGHSSRGDAEIAESRRVRQTRSVHKKVPKGRTTIAQGNALWTLAPMPGSRPAGLNTCRRRCEEALTFPLPPPVLPGVPSGVARSEDGSLSNGPPRPPQLHSLGRIWEIAHAESRRSRRAERASQLKWDGPTTSGAT